jgi:hypothetical protein
MTSRAIGTALVTVLMLLPAAPASAQQSGRRSDVPAAQGVGQPRVGEPRTEDGAFAVRKDIRCRATGLAGAGGKRAER